MDGGPPRSAPGLGWKLTCPECLNASCILSLVDARDQIEAFRVHLIEERPHSTLGDLNPKAFAAQAQPA